MLNLQKGIIYGPVHSRRLGTSLGLNILGSRTKVCSFDCVYCQYGWTGEWENESKDIHLPEPDEVKQALTKRLSEIDYEPDFITFSGNGEATLHPRFSEIVDKVIEVRDKFSPSSKTAILSNSSEVYKKEVKQALQKLDEIIMKLDAGNAGVFSYYNQPRKYVDLDIITEELADMKNIIIQTLFCTGTSGNFTDDNIAKWFERIKKIKPSFVQLYSLDRGYPSESIGQVSMEELEKIKLMLEKENIKSSVY
ncbi:MAG: radical SAM protein [Ignavibacteriae bacterium]|nr:MAG: radical SAM protein [Ignavibacteriota bacterium]